jgi:hypothetical protein
MQVKFCRAGAGGPLAVGYRTRAPSGVNREHATPGPTRTLRPSARARQQQVGRWTCRCGWSRGGVNLLRLSSAKVGRW